MAKWNPKTLNASVCLCYLRHLKSNSVTTLSPIPSRPIPIDRARREKENDTKIMGLPFKENFLAPYHVLRKSYRNLRNID
jgi:hypothetical protein